MSFDAVFEEPELADDPEEFVGVSVTTYHAAAARTGSVWSVTVQGLPDGHAVQAQGATWAEAEENAHACVTDVLKADPVTVAVRLLPADSEAAEAILDVADARIARAKAEQAERDAATHAARTLVGKGWTTRDAGTALRLSHQRISQLAPRTTP